jgi:hypothetical protein
MKRRPKAEDSHEYCVEISPGLNHCRSGTATACHYFMIGYSAVN